MAKDPAFSFYAQDFLTDTFQWTRAAKGLHCELLSIAWINGFIEADENGDPLEMDEDGLKLWRSRVCRKWILRDGKLYNNRLEETRESRKKFKDNQSAKGKKSAERRATEYKPERSRGSTAVQPSSPVEPFEKEKEYEEEREYEDQEGGVGETRGQKFLIPEMAAIFKRANPSYPAEKYRDGPALLSIAKFLAERGNLRGAPEAHIEAVLAAWENLAAVIAADRFYGQKSLTTISNHIQEILQKTLHGDKSKPSSGHRQGSPTADETKAALRKRTGVG